MTDDPAIPQQGVETIRHCLLCNFIVGTHSLNLCLHPDWCGCYCQEDDGTFPGLTTATNEYPHMIYGRMPDALRAADKQIIAAESKAREFDAAFDALERALRAAIVAEHLRHAQQRTDGEWINCTVDKCRLSPCVQATAALALAEAVRS